MLEPGKIYQLKRGCFYPYYSLKKEYEGNAPFMLTKAEFINDIENREIILILKTFQAKLKIRDKEVCFVYKIFILNSAETCFIFCWKNEENFKNSFKEVVF